MKLNYTYIIGTHVMFYEIEMFKEYIDSLIQAVHDIETPDRITFDFMFNISQYLESIDTSKISKQELIDKFNKEIERLKNSNTGLNVDVKIYDDDNTLYCIADYRRDFNYYNCTKYDYLMWGETDALLPKQLFDALENIKKYASLQNIHRYTVWFAERKMWDDSWAPLEHVDFENEKYISIKHFNTEEEFKAKISKSPHSIRYVMDIDEMNQINDKADTYDIRVLQYPKFNGCGLIMSNDLIKAGVNIPPAMFGVVAEDTAMMISAHQIMGQAYIQFIVKNILLVHNREHTKKRLYCLDKNTNLASGLGDSYKHGKGDWFDSISHICKSNLNLLGPMQHKFQTLKDFNNEN